MQAPFSFGEPEPLQTLFAEAGFPDVRFEPVIVDTDYGDPEGYVARQITGARA
jgi:hypothetical protein